jgi:peptidoglycan/xylan/chitin deacetylase (PgdA/CDA1 family)
VRGDASESTDPGPGTAGRNLQAAAISRRTFTLAAALALTGSDNPAGQGRAGPPTPGPGAAAASGRASGPPAPVRSPPGKEQIVAAFAGQVPRAWGLQIPGVLTRLPAGSTGIALTFDCCGGPGGNAVDQVLIDTLQKEGTPCDVFPELPVGPGEPRAREVAGGTPLFDVGNHGTRHLPLSVSGRSAYGIPGTASVAGVYDEIMVNQEALYTLTGGTARHFRPGTAYLDDIAVGVVRALGLVPVPFGVNGDGGATYPAPVVSHEVSKARAGDIVIAHANQPKGGTAAGISRALPALHAAGIAPVRLTET